MLCPRSVGISTQKAVVALGGSCTRGLSLHDKGDREAIYVNAWNVWVAGIVSLFSEDVVP